MTKNSNRLTQLDGNLSYQIDYTANFNKSFRREFQAKHINKDISPDEFTILYALSQDPDISQSELAKLLFKGKAHVGKILNDMEERGIIKRYADTRNNLIVKRNEITPLGLEIFEKGNCKADKIKELFLEEFTQDEIITFIKFLKKYRKVLRSIVDVKLK